MLGDLCTINDHLKFKNFKNIYHLELQLKKEIISTSEASFLNLSIKIESKKLKTQLCDKRDAFPFLLFVFHIRTVTFLQIFTLNL